MKVINRSRGRPWVYGVETARSIAAAIAEGASKKEACAKAGVAYSSFMRWQRQNRSLRRSVEKARQMWRDSQCMERDLKVLLSEEPVEIDKPSHRHNRRPLPRSERSAGQVDEADAVVAPSSGSDRHDRHATDRGRRVHAV